MKNRKRLIPVVCAVLLASFALGATGVISLRGTGDGTAGSTLIGILVTREYLDTFDSDRYFDENIGSIIKSGGGEISRDDRLRYGGRVWATPTSKELPSEDGSTAVTEMDYVFEGISGLRFIYPSMQDENGPRSRINADDGICDVNTHIDANDKGFTTRAEGTIYFVPPTDDEHFFFNPVYQTADGRVYALPGNSVSFTRENTAGTSMGMSFSGILTQTENGREIAVSGTEVSICVKIMDEQKKISVLQFSADNALLKSEEFFPGQLPESMAPLPETDYILVDTETASKEPGYDHDRQVFSRQESFLYAFACGEDGICIKQQCELLWPDASAA